MLEPRIALTLHPPALTSGGAEVLKWLAFVLMVGDHVNALMLGRSEPALYAAGRLVLPIFAFVLAYYVAQGGEPSARRVLKRLVVWAVLTQPIYMVVRPDFALNVLFTLALGLALAQYGFEDARGDQRVAVWLSAAMLGYFAEFAWFGIWLIVAVHRWCRAPSQERAWLVLAALIVLSLPNRNAWALAAIPVILLVGTANVPVPRASRIFYALYPIHFAVIALATR